MGVLLEDEAEQLLKSEEEVEAALREIEELVLRLLDEESNQLADDINCLIDVMERDHNPEAMWDSEPYKMSPSPSESPSPARVRKNPVARYHNLEGSPIISRANSMRQLIRQNSEQILADMKGVRAQKDKEMVIAQFVKNQARAK